MHQGKKINLIVGVVLIGILCLLYPRFERKQTRRALIKAVEENDIATIGQYLKIGGSPYFTLSDEDIADDLIFLACQKSKEDVIQLILSRGFSLNYTNHGSTPLNVAVWKGNPSIVKLLIKSGLNINHKTDSDWTPLIQTIYCGTKTSKEMANDLIKAGAIVNPANTNDRPPLAFAVEWGKVEFIKLLIDAGADIHAVDPKTGRGVFESIEQNPKETRKFISEYLGNIAPK